MLIITPANLFCSMHTQMNINATEDDSRACVVPHERTQTDADRRQKLEHAHSCELSVRRRVRRLSLLFKSVEEVKSLICHACTRATAHKDAPFPRTLSQQQKDGKRKESVLSEINREIIP